MVALTVLSCAAVLATSACGSQAVSHSVSMHSTSPATPSSSAPTSLTAAGSTTARSSSSPAPATTAATTTTRAASSASPGGPARGAGALFGRHFALATAALLRYVVIPLRARFASSLARRRALSRASPAISYAEAQLRLAAGAAALSPALRRLKLPLVGLVTRVSALRLLLGRRPFGYPSELLPLVAEIGAIHAAAGASGFPVPVLAPPPL